MECQFFHVLDFHHNIRVDRSYFISSQPEIQVVQHFYKQKMAGFEHTRTGYTKFIHRSTAKMEQIMYKLNEFAINDGPEHFKKSLALAHGLLSVDPLRNKSKMAVELFPHPYNCFLPLEMQLLKDLNASQYLL